jgi:hypothetical protein
LEKARLISPKGYLHQLLMSHPFYRSGRWCPVVQSPDQQPQLKEWSTSSNWSFTNPSPISQIKTYFTYFTNMKRDWFFCRMTDRWYPSYSSLTDSSHYVMCILRIYNFVSFRKWQVSFTLFNLLVSVGNFEVKYRANILNLLEYVCLVVILFTQLTRHDTMYLGLIAIFVRFMKK